MVPEGWVKSTLEHLISIKHGFAFKSEYFSNSGQYILMTPGNFFESGGFRSQGKKTKYYIGEIPSNYILAKNEIVVAMTEQASGLLGSAAYVPESETYLHNQRLGLIKVIDSLKIDIDFVYWIYNSKTIRKQISEQASGTKVKHTSPERLTGVVTLLPPVKEQQKIAKILSTWDQAITVMEQLIHNRKKQKQWITQQLFTKKQPLQDHPEKWKKITLGNLGHTYSGLTGKTKDDFGFGNRYIPYKNIFTNSAIDTNSFDLVNISPNENQSKVKFGDIFFTISSETPEEVGMSSVLLKEVTNVYLNSFCFGLRLFNFDTLIPEYARFLLRSNPMRKAISALAQGATRYNISKKKLMQLEVLLPPVLEQQKISKILLNADDEILNLQLQLDKLKQEKKALMQQLLTGKRRVKVEAA